MTSATAIEKPDLSERIAQALPLEQREEYWHEMAYLKHLHSDADPCCIDAKARVIRGVNGLPRKNGS